MSQNGSSDQGGNSGSDSGPQTPATTPRKVVKGAQWRKRKRALVERRSATESSGSEPDEKKSRKSIAATSKFFRGVKGKGGKAKKKLLAIEKEPDDSDYSPSSDSGTDSDDYPEDWSPEEKEEEEVNDSVHGEEEEEGEGDETFHLSDFVFPCFHVIPCFLPKRRDPLQVSVLRAHCSINVDPADHSWS